MTFTAMSPVTEQKQRGKTEVEGGSSPSSDSSPSPSSSKDNDEYPLGCSMVHPFAARSDVHWKNQQSNVFNSFSWEYCHSNVTNLEFERFQYRSFLGIIVPISLWFADFFYPLTLSSRGLADPWILSYFVVGLIFMVLIPLHIISHVRKSGSPAWRKVQVANAILGLFNLTIFMGYQGFEGRYVVCNEFVDPLLGQLGRNEDTFGFSKDRETIYCHENIHAFGMWTLICAPVATNLAPRTMLIYYLIRFVFEVSARPLKFYVGGGFSPVEPWQHLVTQGIVLLYGLGAGYTVYWFKTMSTKEQFEAAITLTEEIQLAEKNREAADLLLCSTVPAGALVRLTEGELCMDQTEDASVLFSDMVEFTRWSSGRSAEAVIKMLNTLTESIDAEAVSRGVEKVKTVGDAYWAVTGLPEKSEQHALVMCQFGLALLRVVSRTSLEETTATALESKEDQQIEVRVGIHSGPLQGGILGSLMISYEVFGETSSIANRVEQMGVPGELVVSQATLEAAGLGDTQTILRCVGEVELGLDESTSRIEQSNDHTTTALRLFVLTSEVVSSGGGKKSITPEASETSSHFRVGENRSRSSLGSATSMRDAGQHRRMAFLRQRAIAQAKRDAREFGVVEEKSSSSRNSSSSLNETLQGFTERHSRLKHRFLLGNFADDAVEQSFLLFALKTHRSMRFWTRVLLFLMTVIVLVATGIDRLRPESAPVTASSLILFILALCVSLGDVALLYITAMRKVADGNADRSGEREWPKSQCFLTHCVPVLLMLGSLLANERASIATNDASWICTSSLVLTHLANSGGVIGTLWLVLINTFIVWPVCWIATWRSFFYGESKATDFQVLIIIGFLCACFEQQTRQQFREVNLQEYFKKEQMQHINELHALLRSVVPAHISGELLQWIQGGMQVPLARSYSQCGVAFMRLIPPSNPAAQTSSGGGGLFVAADLPLQPLELALGDDSPQQHTASVPASSLFSSTLAGDWHFPAMLYVDAILEKEEKLGAGVLSKIKTIGDVIMLAGPFFTEDEGREDARLRTSSSPSHHDSGDGLVGITNAENPLGGTNDGATGGASLIPRSNGNNTTAATIDVDDAALQQTLLRLIGVFQALMRLDSLGGVQGGIHCGPLVGAIQGTSRICFDIFGDTVNQASRVMTGNEQLIKASIKAATGSSSSNGSIRPAFCAVSKEVKEVALRSESTTNSKSASNNLRFEPTMIEAKGKGTLETYIVSARSSSSGKHHERASASYPQSGDQTRAEKAAVLDS